jgi:hypothetical protein
MFTERNRKRMTFNPSERIVKIKTKEGEKKYLPVKWSIVWFRENCPKGTIETFEIQIDIDREVEARVTVWDEQTRKYQNIIRKGAGYARFKAKVSDGYGAFSEGTKTENGASFQDYVEKAETGAIGRALANLGYGTQFGED